MALIFRPLIIALVALLALAGCAGYRGVGEARAGTAAPAPRRSGSRWTGRRTPTTPASTWPSRRATSGAAGLDVEFLPVQQRVAGHPGLLRRRRVRDQLPGLVHRLQGRRRRHHVGDGRAAALGDRRSPCAPTGPTSPRPRTWTARSTAGSAPRTRSRKMRAVIRDAGGAGNFTTVVLGTAAYEALYAGQVDFTEPFVAWEGIEAELRGQPLKTFNYTDYGFPDAYSVILIGNSPWLTAAPRPGRRVRAGRAARLPAGRRRPGPGRSAADGRQPGRVHRAGAGAAQPAPAQRAVPARRVRPGRARRPWRSGRATPGSLFDSGALTGPDGAPLTARPDFATWFTNDYLAKP